LQSFLNDKIHLYAGDCLEVLATLPENSMDSCVTDPPYHLVSIYKRFANEVRNEKTVGKHAYGRHATGFMGKQWDGGDIAFRPELWIEVYRVLKPGAHLLAFGGTRTYHRMACAIEDAGFEIRDCIQWLYGSGFPKSHDVSKGIDRAAGAEREVIGSDTKARSTSGNSALPTVGGNTVYQTWDLTCPTTDATRQWQGWGTALKPACEPIVLARKPLSEKTAAANVLRWGTGAINVGGCRIPSGQDHADKCSSVVGLDSNRNGNCYGGGWVGKRTDSYSPAGRWPANVIHDGSDEVVGAFPESNSGPASGYNWEQSNNDNPTRIANNIKSGVHFGDEGSAARFFYTAKADSDDRLGSKHPTVKPLDLMQYLVRLVTPKGGLVLDPFAGTGTTGEAAFREGMRAVLIEREAEYLKDIERRVELIMAGPDERAFKAQKAKQDGKQPDYGPLFGGESNWDDMWSRPFERPELVWGNKS
jgi:site-specific DNA-methyltransferase (adenine-specific)